MTLRPLRLAVVALLPALALAACSSWPESPIAPPPAPPPGKPLASAVERHRAPPVPRQLQQRPPAAKPQTPPPAEEAAAPPPNLVGLSEADTAALLGQPTEQADQAPGKIWTYRAEGCALSVHLFPEMDGGGFYALDYTADGDLPRDTCLRRIADAHHKA